MPPARCAGLRNGTKSARVRKRSWALPSTKTVNSGKMVHVVPSNTCYRGNIMIGGCVTVLCYCV